LSLSIDSLRSTIISGGSLRRCWPAENGSLSVSPS
jgi:hypothetical protein